MVLLLLILSGSFAYARVEICFRKAQIINGLVNHYWIRTDYISAGMGSGLVEKIGDRLELPFVTKVFVVDHSAEIPDRCEVVEDIDEDCINSHLKLGRSLGRFSLRNNCQTFVKKLLRRCGPKEEKIPARIYSIPDYSNEY